MQSLIITASALSEIVKNISDKIEHNHISNITVINSSDLFVSLSNYRKEKLLISLNPAHPFISLIEIKNPCGTKVCGLSDTLRKEVKDSYLIKVETVNSDRIVSFKYIYTNDYFDKEERFLILELIPHRPNLILLNSERKILFATHYADLTNDRPIAKGLTYQTLPNTNTISDTGFDYEKFKKISTDYYQTATRKRLEEQYKPVLQHIKSRIKTLKQKLKVLNNEMQKAKENFVYKEIGSTILTLAYNKDDLNTYIKESGIEYDVSQTPGVNANKYFSKYKKAKRTIEMDEIELDKTEKEIDYLETCLSQAKYMNEDDILEMANLLFPKKFRISPKQKVQSKIGEINKNGFRILFGKNAKQNDELTFKKANKKDLFLHIQNEHGSHVIIQGDNPDNETILTACEIALLLSDKDCGDIQYTLVKNVKKGSYLGQAILTSYETYTLKNVRSETAKMLRELR